MRTKRRKRNSSIPGAVSTFRTVPRAVSKINIFKSRDNYSKICKIQRNTLTDVWNRKQEEESNGDPNARLIPLPDSSLNLAWGSTNNKDIRNQESWIPKA